MRIKILYALIVIAVLSGFSSSYAKTVSAAQTERLFTHKYSSANNLYGSISHIVIADVLKDEQFLIVGEYGEEGYLLMKMDEKTITLTKSFGSGDIQFVKELGLIFFLNAQTKMLEVYNESLQLVATQDVKKYVPDTFSGQHIDFYVHNQYISYHFESYSYKGEPIIYNNNSTTGFIYDSVQQKLSTHAQFSSLPVDRIVYSNAYMLHQIDALGRVKKQIRYFTPNEQEEVDVRLLHMNDVTSTVGVQYFSSVQYTLNKINMQGAISDKHTLYGYYTPVPYRYSELTATHYRIFSLEESSYYDYDAQTHTLSEKQKLPLWLTYNNVSALNESFYYFTHAGEILVTPNTSVEPAYKVRGDFILQQTEQFALALTAQYNDARLFNIADGTVLDVFDQSTFRFIDEHYLAVIQHDYDEFSSNFTVSIHALPNKHAVSSNKVWTVTFNDHINASTVTNSTVYVTNAQNKKQDVTLRVQNNKLLIEAPKSLYHKGTYVLHIDGVASKSGISLKEKVMHHFTIQ